MAETFFDDLAGQLRRNIGDAFQTLSVGDMAWGEFLAQILSQLLLSVLYLGVFFGAYLVLIGVLRILLGRQRAKLPLFLQVRSSLRYLFGLGALVVILAQFGASPEVLKAMARAGLMALGFDVISIVAGLGIVGIAVGFAAQSTLSNFIAGITLLIERPFRIGDWVTINGQDGKVDKIALRTIWMCSPQDHGRHSGADERGAGCSRHRDSFPPFAAVH